MKYEETLKTVQNFVFSGKDPFVIAKEITDWIIKTSMKATCVNQELAREVNEWIDEWLDLFPEGMKSGGKLIRSDRKMCFQKMVKFRKDYPLYDKEIVMRATKEYLKEKSYDGFLYTKCATYLIHKKEEGSELAALCRNLLVRKEVDAVETHVEKINNFQEGYFL